MGRKLNLSWIFGVSWFGRWLRTSWMKRDRLRAKRGALGDDELVTAPKYGGKWLADNKNGGGSSRHIKIIYATTAVVTVNILQGSMLSAPRKYSFVMSGMLLMFLMLIPKNEIIT